MGPRDEYPALRAALRILQTIVGMLLMGVLVFLGVATYLTLNRSEPPTEPPLLTYILMGTALVAIVAVAYLAAAIVKRARRDLAEDRPARMPGAAAVAVPAAIADSGDAGRLFPAFQTATILRAASYEGAAFLCLVAAIVEGHVAGLVGGAMMAVLLALQIPTGSRAEHHLEAELAEVAGVRQER